MNPTRKRRLWLIAAIVIAAGIATALVALALQRNVAYLYTPSEILGGSALVLGIYARQVSLALVPVMLSAASVHIHNGWVFTSQGGGWEYPVFLAVASVVLYLLGDGAAAMKRSRFLVPSAA